MAGFGDGCGGDAEKFLAQFQRKMCGLPTVNKRISCTQKHFRAYKNTVKPRTKQKRGRPAKPLGARISLQLPAEVDRWVREKSHTEGRTIRGTISTALAGVMEGSR